MGNEKIEVFFDDEAKVYCGRSSEFNVAYDSESIEEVYEVMNYLIQDYKDTHIQRHGGSFPPQKLDVFLSGQRVRAFVASEDCYYFNSVDVSSSLGITHVKDFRDRLPDEDKLSLREIVGEGANPPYKNGGSFTSEFGARPQSIYLSERAMWLGVLAGTTDACVNLRGFIASTVMPEIARTGSFIGTLEDKSLIPLLVKGGVSVDV